MNARTPIVLVVVSLGLGISALAADTGSIVGRIDEPGQVTSVQAVDRKSGKRFHGQCDPVTGQFTVDSLPLGADYDCVVDFKEGRLEGVNLKVPRSDYEQEQPLSAEDIETIKTKVGSMNAFENVVEVMTVAGNIQHAAVLLNKLRTTPFYASKPGEIIWRVELWHYERPEEDWVKVQDELFVTLYRERIPRTAFDKKSITFDPNLGGIRLTSDQTRADLGAVALPAGLPGVRVRSAGAVRTGKGE